MTTDYLRPNSNINSLWSVSTYQNIDDDVLTGAAGDGATVEVSRTDDNEAQQYGLTSPSVSFSTVTNATVHLRSFNDDDGDTHNLNCRLFIGGVWTSQQTLVMGGPSYAWTDADFTGSWTGADFASAQIELLTGSISNSENYQIDVLYVELTGSGADTYDETGSGGAVFGGAAIVKPDVISETQSAGDGTNDASWGTIAWSNVGNITTLDGTFAQTAELTNQSNVLKASDFGFSLPDVQYLRGVEINITRRASHDTCGGAGRRVVDDLVSLVIDGTADGSNYADQFTPANACASWDATTITHTYGGSDDLWGLDLQVADILNANFGCAFQVSGNIGDEIAYVDHIEMTVYYQNSLAEIYDENATGGAVLGGTSPTGGTSYLVASGGAEVAGSAFVTTCPDSFLCDNFTGDAINLSAHYIDAVNGSNTTQWTIVNGTWTLESNQLKINEEGTRIIYVDVGHSSYSADMSFTVPTGTATMFQGFIVRRSDNSNYIRANYNTTTNALQIWTVVSGAFTLRASASVTLSGSEIMSLDVSGDTITLAADGVTASYTTSFNNTATNVGITVGVVPSSGTYSATYIDSISVSQVALGHEATGGIVFGGSATAQLHFSYEASGGLTTGGDADADSDLSYVASGGLTFGGQADVRWHVAFAPSGAIRFSGVAPSSSSAYQYTSSGGIEFYNSANVQISLSHAPSGGITFSGSAPVETTWKYTPANEPIRFSGTAPVVYTTSQYSYEASGGISFGGSAPISTYYHYPSGGITFGGEARPVSVAYSWFAAGGISFDGEVETDLTQKVTGQGGISFGGSAPVQIVYGRATGNGGISFGGEAPLRINFTSDPVAIFHNGYKFRRQLKFTSTSSVSNFPLLFHETLGTGKVTTAGACDVIFEDSQHNQLNHEIEYFNADTGELFAHFKANISKGDNYFWMYYGKVKEICDEEDVAGTWSNFVNVYHLNESGNGTSGEFVDVKGSLNGTGGSSVFVPSQVTGKIYRGQDYSGISSFIKTADDEVSNTSDFSVSCWAKTPSAFAGKQILWSRNKTDLGDDEGWSIELGIDSFGSPTASVQVDNGDDTWSTITATSATSLSVSTWYHLALVWDSGTSLKIYANGVLKNTTSTAKTTLVDGSAGNYFGRRDTGSYFKGILDELRVSQSALSADWMLNEYLSGSQSLVIGPEQISMAFSGVALVKLGYVAVPSGGISFSGTGVYRFTKVSTGGIAFGGSANTAFALSHVATGGITFSDSANAQQRLSHVSSGGISFGGEAPFQINRTFTPSGGITFSGTTTAQPRFSHVASGGIVFGGSANGSIPFSHVASGGISFSGSADYQQQLAHVPSGGVTFAGSADVYVTRDVTPVGGIVFGGTTSAQPRFSHVASGGISFGGSANGAVPYSHEASGGISFSGSADSQQRLSHVSSGGISFAGTADVYVERQVTPSGGITFSGNATARPRFSYTPSGGIIFAGIATTSSGFSYSASGGITFSNSAEGQPKLYHTPLGGIVLGGHAELGSYYHVASGGISFGGVSPLFVHRLYIPTGGIKFGKAITNVDGDISGEIFLPPALSGEIFLPPAFSGEIQLEQVATGEVV